MINTGSTLKICPRAGTVKHDVQSTRPAHGAESARRRDAVRHVPGAGPLHHGPVGPGSRRAARRSTPTPSASTSSGSAKPASSTSSRCGGGRSGGPSTSTSSPRARRRSGSTRPRTRCSPGCWPRSPSASAPTPPTPPTPGGCGAPTPDAAPGPTSCLTALESELTRLGFEPATEAGRRRARGKHADRLPPLPVPRARRGVPRARLQPAPWPLRRRGRCRRRGKS